MNYCTHKPFSLFNWAITSKTINTSQLFVRFCLFIPVKALAQLFDWLSQSRQLVQFTLFLWPYILAEQMAECHSGRGSDKACIRGWLWAAGLRGSLPPQAWGQRNPQGNTERWEEALRKSFILFFFGVWLGGLWLMFSFLSKEFPYQKTVDWDWHIYTNMYKMDN